MDKKKQKKRQKGKKTKKRGLMQPILCLWDSQSQAWRNAEWPFLQPMGDISDTHNTSDRKMKKKHIEQR